MRCAYIFRRDLRIADNTALIAADRECDEVIPIFILDPRQVDENKNHYLSPYALGFMLDSLRELDEDLGSIGSRLHVLRGVAEEVVGLLRVNAVYLNEDYTPFSVARDARIERIRAVRRYEDLLLTGKDLFIKGGKPYNSFSRFYRDAKKIPVRKPNYTKPKKLGIDRSLPGVEELKLGIARRSPKFRGGRREGLELIERAREIDYPRESTMLSPHLKFGTVSVREVYHSIEREDIRRQLYWRDFFTLLAYYNPHVFGKPYRREYECIEWESDEERFRRWREGKTGFPIVDAAMRELNETGYIHNRLRMIAAFVLVKVLHIDWRLGERYFATRLVDYDPAVNNGNWQWVASTGTDYIFRVFNPWLQGRKLDPDAEYIKTWVRELRGLSAEEIHSGRISVPDYPKAPDWRAEVEKARERYRIARVKCGSKTLKTYITATTKT